MAGEIDHMPKRNNPAAGKTAALPDTGFVVGSIEDEIRKIAASAPRKDWDRVPRDLAVNLDHYLYGAPKRQ